MPPRQSQVLYAMVHDFSGSSRRREGVQAIEATESEQATKGFEPKMAEIGHCRQTFGQPASTQRDLEACPVPRFACDSCPPISFLEIDAPLHSRVANNESPVWFESGNVTDLVCPPWPGFDVFTASSDQVVL